MVAFTHSYPSDSSHFLRQPHPTERGGFDMLDCEVISILGADCPIGRQIIEISLRCGYEVQALTQTALEPSPDKDLRVLQSESFDERHIQTVVRGSTCVINLCNMGGCRAAQGGMSSVSISQVALHAMQQSRTPRYLLVTHPGVRFPSDHKLAVDGFTSRYVWPIVHRQRARELQEEANLVMKTDLNWTIVRCPKIKTVATMGSIRVNRNKPMGRFVATDRLARYLVHLKDSDTYNRQAIFVASVSVRKN